MHCQCAGFGLVWWVLVFLVYIVWQGIMAFLHIGLQVTHHPQNTCVCLFDPVNPNHISILLPAQRQLTLSECLEFAGLLLAHNACTAQMGLELQQIRSCVYHLVCAVLYCDEGCVHGIVKGVWMAL